MNMIDFARESIGLTESSFVELIPLAVRGSDRTFFRLTWGNNNSAILVNYEPKRVENAYYADISLFLQSIGVSVPKLIRHDQNKCLMLMEDLGSQDLWSFRDASWTARSRLYQKTLVILSKLHSVSEKDFPSQRVKLMKSFGPDLYRWERNYFKEHFINGICKIKLEPSHEVELETELSALAERLDSTKRSLIHRDMQSQNVMIRDGEPFLIDFQGMRFGNPFYDLGSLLCDPYVVFSDKQINELLLFYYGLSERNLEWSTFQGIFWEASAQRLMQALGAYGFLGVTKGLTTFLAHIPAGLNNLSRATSHVASLPLLHDLAGMCREVVEQNNFQ